MELYRFETVIDDLGKLVSYSPEWKNVSTANMHLAHLTYEIVNLRKSHERLVERNEWLEQRHKDREFVRELPQRQKKEALKAQMSTDNDFHYFWMQNPKETDFRKLYVRRFKREPMHYK